MAERATALGRLQRLLYILPAAGGEGMSIDELARKLGEEPRQILRDLEEVTAREFYLPAGAGGGIQIALEPDRVRVWTTGDFQRPVRLDPREALALSVGFRSLAAEAEGERRERILAASERIESALVDVSIDDMRGAVGVSAAAGARDGMRSFLTEAIRAGRRCHITYLKPGDDAPDRRDVEPRMLACATGAWYLIGRCLRADAVRVFRLDRVLDAHMLDESFALDEDFDPSPYLDNGRIYYRADQEMEVTIRYDASVARWVKEEETVEELPGGDVLVRHRVSDPSWLIRHVLRFESSAEVIAPEEARQFVREALGRMLNGLKGPLEEEPAPPLA